MFRDLSVKSIVIPPASTGTTAISRAAVQCHESASGTMHVSVYGTMAIELLPRWHGIQDLVAGMTCACYTGERL